jgi:hypothetical protein
LELVFGLRLGAAACAAVDVNFGEGVLGVQQLAALGFPESFWACWDMGCPRYPVGGLFLDGPGCEGFPGWAESGVVLDGERRDLGHFLVSKFAGC